jgi:ECF sigma factor
MSEVARILSALKQGDPHVAEQLLPPVYDKLRQLAARRLAEEKPGSLNSRSKVSFRCRATSCAHWRCWGMDVSLCSSDEVRR